MILQPSVKPNGSAPAGTAVAPRRLPKWAILVVIALVLAAAVLIGLSALRSRAAPSYETAPVLRGNLDQTVTASGTINAQDTISVGTQVSGTIATLYVDYNSRVRRGQVLAQIDPSQFQAQLAQARASLAQAQAQASAGSQTALGASYGAQASAQAIISARADLIRAQAAADLAGKTLERDRLLLRNGYIARSQYDTDYSAAVAAGTTLRSAQSMVIQTLAQAQQASAGAGGSRSSALAAAAAVDAASALVQQDALNLERSTIVSPVDGTVVARNVSVGQTVAASFQTPTLFTIARDLRKMEADIAVGEPDIGNVRPGESVNFTVLAYPNRTFHGTVSQVRENPTTIANVVTYTVVVLVGNLDNVLLPGMTANASISVASVSRALLVPIQALQYRPATAARSGRAAGGASPWGQTGADVSGAVVAGSHRRLFVLRDGKPVAVRVTVQLVNGTTAAVTPLSALKAGEPVIVNDTTSASRSQAVNPAYRDGFALECAALKRAREAMGFSNIVLMIPFCRRVEEARRVLEQLEAFGLRRGEGGLQVYMMCEIPNNVILIDEFAAYFDGFSIGSNDLTQLLLGVDRDSEIVAFDYDERDAGVLAMLRMTIDGAKRSGRHVGICGQAPSDYPEMAKALVEMGIESMSLNPDSLLRTRRFL